MKTLRLIIKGNVQGVFYRASAKNMADRLGINGWVRNLPDNQVEIIASADEAVLQEFITWCKQGPPKATVEEVIAEPLPYKSFSGFRILR